MREVAQRECVVVKRERQSFVQMEEISKKTAELMLIKEGSFFDRTVGALKAITEEFASLRHAINEKGIAPTTIGDDAKRGKDNTPSSRADKGKQIVEYKGNTITSIVQAVEPTKLLASFSAAFHKAASRVSIPFDTTLEAMQSFELKEKGLVEIQQVKPIQTVPTQAAPVATAKAVVTTQAAPIQTAQAEQTKTVIKRPAPTVEEADLVAKR